MKKYLYFSIAALALTSCSDEFVGEGTGTGQKGNLDNAILFSSSSKGQTRGDHYGTDAAWLLGSHFVVEGTKGATSVATTTVFDNYNVIYEANTAGTTESNTADWEYVDKPVNTYAAGRGISAQTIKYWDYSQAQYDFIAYSTGTTAAADVVSTANPAADKLYVSDITPSTATNATGGAYKVQGNTTALSKFYIADLVTVLKADYGKEVQLKFRNLSSKVRVALYETVPGYSVRDVEFYESNDATTIVADNKVTLFSSSSNIATAGTYTVYYPTVNSTDSSVDGYQATDMNKAHVAFTADATDGTSTTTVYAALDYVRDQTSTQEEDQKYLGTTSSTATYAGSTADKTYYTVLPNESATALTLRVNYTLVSDDGSEETIKVWGAKAVVPAQYCQWKSNYAYTYIFKISDNTNGATEKLGGAVEGLHPITFDAVVTDSEDGIQETVTTVATPSITTYSPGVQPTANNEYKNNSYIYAMVMQEGTIQKISADHPVVVYSLDKAATEAEVMDALNMGTESAGTVTGRNGLVLTPQSHDATITTIPGADGNNITITAGDAAVFHPTTAGTYAVVYGVAAGTPTTYYSAIVPAAGASVEGMFTDFACTNPATGTADGSTVYYQQLTNNNTKYAVKVVKVVD